MRFPGPFHNLAAWLAVDHMRASSFAVATVEFLVQQKIMIGFLHECVLMTSWSLQSTSAKVPNDSSMNSYLELHILSNAKSLALD